jgi:hypothetical protein
VDIDAVVAHFSEDAEMRSPLAEKLTGSAVVQGADNIRQYWQRAYGHVKSADLQILTWSWDDNICRSGGVSTERAQASSWISTYRHS